MLKPRRQHRQPGLTRKDKAPLPPEKVAAMPWVWSGYTGRLVAPWQRHPLWPEEEAQLLAVMATVDALRPAGVVWLWPDGRPPVPVNADNAVAWADRWGAERASYVRR